MTAPTVTFVFTPPRPVFAMRATPNATFVNASAPPSPVFAFQKARPSFPMPSPTAVTLVFIANPVGPLIGSLDLSSGGMESLGPLG